MKCNNAKNKKTKKIMKTIMWESPKKPEYKEKIEFKIKESKIELNTNDKDYANIIKDIIECTGFEDSTKENLLKIIVKYKKWSCKIEI